MVNGVKFWIPCYSAQWLLLGWPFSWLGYWTSAHAKHETTSGLTRGRGMAESQRNQWLLSMPAYAEVNSAMQELTDTYCATSEQHKDVTGQTEQRRGRQENSSWVFAGQEPFQDDTSLRNIATCVTAIRKWLQTEQRMLDARSWETWLRRML